MNNPLNIVITGLTGQGIVMLTNVIANALLSEGHMVLTSDVPPSTHRYTPMFSLIRSGKGVYSMTVSKGKADVLLGFEPKECLKIGALFASKDCVVIMNNRFLDISGTLNSIKKPLSMETIFDEFAKFGVHNVNTLDLWGICLEETGSVQFMNMVMLGFAVAMGAIPVKQGTAKSSIEHQTPTRDLETNLRAFCRGIAEYKKINQ